MTSSEQTGQLRAAVIGSPVAQSLSPLIHAHWFEEAGLNGVYSAIDVAPNKLAAVFDQFKREGFSGFNITVPHKTAILPLLDKIAPAARQMGAVNTVKIAADGTTTGINTDGIGFIKHLKNAAPGWPKDRPALLLGAGGAARAAALALLNDGVPLVMISNRTREKASLIAEEIGRGRMVAIDWDERSDAVAGAGLVVNTTVLGMQGQASLDIDLSSALRDTVVYDIVYKPLETALLKQARQYGLKTVDGLGMLVYQGAAAFKAWFGFDACYDDVLRRKLLTALGEEPAP